MVWSLRCHILSLLLHVDASNLSVLVGANLSLFYIPQIYIPISVENKTTIFLANQTWCPVLTITNPDIIFSFFFVFFGKPIFFFGKPNLMSGFDYNQIELHIQFLFSPINLFKWKWRFSVVLYEKNEVKWVQTRYRKWSSIFKIPYQISSPMMMVFVIKIVIKLVSKFLII